MNIQKNIKLNGINISNDSSLILILGPCQLESLSHSIMIIETILNICEKHKLEFIFKSSFDKANRTSHSSIRGLGLDQGLKIFQELKAQFDVPILTDVHHPAQCELVAPIVDIPEDEQKNYPIPGKDGEFYTNKLDIENCKRFKKNEFDKALIDMGVLSKDFKGSLMNAS